MSSNQQSMVPGRCAISRCPRFGTAKLVYDNSDFPLAGRYIMIYLYLVVHPTNRVGRLVHPSCKWINRTYPIYNQGYNML